MDRVNRPPCFVEDADGQVGALAVLILEFLWPEKLPSVVASSVATNWILGDTFTRFGRIRGRYFRYMCFSGTGQNAQMNPKRAAIYDAKAPTPIAHTGEYGVCAYHCRP